jgi:protein-tyrosine kinase
VSRIDEALRRSGNDKRQGSLSVTSHQRHFSSAWTEEEAETLPVSKPAAVAAPAPVPVVAPAPVPVAAPAPVRPAARVEMESRPMSVDGAFPVLRASCGERLISDPRCSAAVVEQFRRLAAVLHKLQAAESTRVVMVTSASPADGKTLTAINLAVVLSSSYSRRVLLVDADLRRPSIGRLTGLDRESGLSEALKARTEQKLTLIPMTPTLTVLPAGAPDPDPTSGLSSPRMRNILHEAAGRFDWVILDAPPVGAVSDANLLAEMVDKMLLVVRAAQTQFPAIQKTIETLGHERIVGVVLNGVEKEALQEYGQYYGRYGG